MKNLIVVSNFFDYPSGPSNTLLHLLRGMGQFFDNIYLISTLPKHFLPNSEIAITQFLPKNVRIIHIPRTNMETLVYGLNVKNSRQVLGKILKNTILKLTNKKNNDFYLYIASDVFNLISLGESTSKEFLCGYNIFFNFAPLQIVKSYTNFEDFFVLDFWKNVFLSIATQKIDLSAVKYVKKILAHTEYQKSLYIKELGIHNKNVVIFPHLIDIDFVRRLASNCKISSLKDSYIFIYVGRLVKEKGIHILLEAFTKVSTKEPNVRLLIVGKGPLSNLVLKYKKKLGPKCQWLGEKTYPETLKLINLSNVLVLPSLHEMFGFVILEAMALGKPVIVTKVGGIKELVESKAGILIEPNSVEALSDAMLQICDGRSQTKEEIQQFVRQHFDVKKRAKEFVKILERYGKTYALRN